MTRAFLKSNVEKHLNDKTIVIFDSLNYIKGIYLFLKKIPTIDDFRV